MLRAPTQFNSNNYSRERVELLDISHMKSDVKYKKHDEQ